MGKFEFMGDKRNKHSGSKGSNVMGQIGMKRERADVRERKWNCWWKKVIAKTAEQYYGKTIGYVPLLCIMNMEILWNSTYIMYRYVL